MQLSTEVVGDVGLIRIHGDVDCLEAPNLDAVTAAMLGDGARSLVIDCSDVDYIDSGGLNVLAKAYNKALAQGGTITVRDPSPSTYRLLKAVGLDEVLVIDGPPAPEENTVS